MDIYEFNYLPGSERVALVWQHGRLLAIRDYMECSVVLYKMPEFFAEVWYSPEDNQIALVHGFMSSKILEPYVESADLEELFGG
ncbi:hypothetical protein [Pontibacter harenae]|uniref:hypothetical protein n=1 Tax=Pontibacter harenae TaxID=2894083 RepID=UPI001E478D65|nr:hypothetical protein [Pontibacter harenae]MCC9167226.1 hypothetical protein [Pontibacter harenae]